MVHLLKKIFKRKVLVILGTLVASAFLFMLSSCSYDMSSITFADETVTYDGESHSIEISGTLPDAVSVSYTGNDQTEVGTYTITASFTGESSWYDSLASLTATLTIKEADMTDVSFESETFTYDGEYHTLEVSGITDTTRYTVSYLNNSQKYAGVYSVIAIVTDSEGTYETLTLTATLTIEQATTYDISFSDVYVVYDGETHSITATNLPTGVTATYTGNDQTEIGEYTVTASFTDSLGNYELSDMTATLYIQESYLSSLSFDDLTYTYDGEYHTITVSGIPDTERFTVSYESNSKVLAGVYSASAIVTDTEGEYEDVYLTATLTIEQATTYDISFTDTYAVYDGESHSITATNIPTGVTVTYTGNAQIAVGEYTVTASFTDELGNYNLEDMTATLYIQEDLISDMAFEDYTVTYDGNGYTITVSNLPANVDATYTYDGVEVDMNTFGGETEAGTYEVVVSFSVDDDEYTIEDMYATLTIEQADTLSDYVNFDDLYFNVYNLESVTMAYSLVDTEVPLPDGVECTYSDSATQTDAGTYEVSVKFTDPNGNYVDLTLTANMTVVNVDTVTADYTIETDSNTLTATVSDYSGTETDIIVPSYVIDTNYVAYKVTAVAANTFNSNDYSTNKNIESIVFNDNITSIGEKCCIQCTGLISVTLPNNEGFTEIPDWCFCNCAFSSLDLPSSVDTIGDYAFYYSDLTEIDLSNITSLGILAFMGSDKLETVTLCDNLTEIPRNCFCATELLATVNSDTIGVCNIPSSVTSIGTYAFGSESTINEVMTTIVTSDNLSEIGYYAFSLCIGLTSITLNEGLTTIGEYAFQGESSSSSNEVSELSIPSTVTSIGDYCFQYNMSLTSLTFEGDGTSVGDYAFYYDNALESIITYDSGSKEDVTIGEYAFTSNSTSSSYYFADFTTAVLSENITSIGYHAFYYDYYLTTITTTSHREDTIASTDNNYMPEKLEYIGQEAFSHCAYLDGDMYFYDNLEYLDKYAFYYTNTLDNVYFGGGLASSHATTIIGYRAFYDSNGIATLYLYGVSNIYYQAFYSMASLTAAYFNLQIQSIGYQAFYASSSLASVYWYDYSGNAADVTFNAKLSSTNTCLGNVTAAQLISSTYYDFVRT